MVTAKSMSGSALHYSQATGIRALNEFGRRVDVSFSDDFVNWSKQKLILWGDEKDQELGKQRIKEILEDLNRRKPLFVNPAEFYTDIYNMAVFTYEDLYLGLPMIFNQSGRYFPGWGGNSDGILYPSRCIMPSAGSRPILKTAVSHLPLVCTLNPHDIVEKSCKTIQMNALQLWHVHLIWCCTTIPI